MALQKLSKTGEIDDGATTETEEAFDPGEGDVVPPQEEEEEEEEEEDGAGRRGSPLNHRAQG